MSVRILAISVTLAALAAAPCRAEGDPPWPPPGGFTEWGVIMLPGVSITPTNRCVHGKGSSSFTATAAGGKEGMYDWRCGSFTLSTTNNTVEIPVDLKNKPGTVSVTFTPLGYPDASASGSASLSYCKRCGPPSEEEEEDHDDCHHHTHWWCCKCGAYDIPDPSSYPHDCSPGTAGGEDPGGGTNAPPQDTTTYLGTVPREIWRTHPNANAHVMFFPARRWANSGGNDGYGGSNAPPYTCDGENCDDGIHSRGCCDHNHGGSAPGYGECCPCPEHNPGSGGGGGGSTNGPLRYVTAYGLIVSTNPPPNTIGLGNVSGGIPIPDGTPVWVTANSPSTALGDRWVRFAWDQDGKTYTRDYTFTAIGMRLFPDREGKNDPQSTANLDLCYKASTAEWVIPAGGGSRPVYLTTYTMLPGTLTFTLDGTPGAFRVWSGSTTNSTLLLGCPGVATNYNPYSIIYQLGTVWVEAVAPGSATFTVRFQGTGVASNYNVVRSFPITTQGAKLNLMWETENKANQIFDPTRKDDKSDSGYQEYDPVKKALYGIHRNCLYLVGGETDGKFRVSLDLNIQPTALRSKFICAAFDQNGNKIVGSDTAVSANPAEPVAMEIPAPSAAEVVTYEIRVGMDSNNNGLLDPDEGEPLFVYRCPQDPNNDFSDQPRYAAIKGITKEKYMAHTNALAFFLNPMIAGIPVDPGPPSLIAKHARSFLYIFYDGTLNMVSNELKPTASGNILIDAFADGEGIGNCYAEWLTHNSGASFSTHGIAAIPLREWSHLSKVSEFLSERTPFALKKLTIFPSGGYMETATGTGGALRTFYESEVQSTAETLLANEPIGSEIVMPRDNPANNEDWYCFPRLSSSLFVNESPKWVPDSTLRVGVGDAYGGKWGAFLSQYLGGTDNFDEYDAAGTIGRGRILNPRYQFTIKKVRRFLTTRYEVRSVRFECVLEDLYDFNYEDSELASHAAALQIGYGKGNNGRENGIIWRNRIIIQRTYNIPFYYQSFIPPP